MGTDLTAQRCVACEGGIPPLTPEQFAPHAGQVPEWRVEDGKRLVRDLACKDFRSALDLVNAVGELAESEGHHPDILIHGWNKVRFTLWTHAIGGLSQNDLILAAKIDEVWASMPTRRRKAK